MLIVDSPVEERIDLDNKIYLLKIHSPEIASTILPGQFLNIKVCEGDFPLLRRPFSVSDVEGEYIYIMFNIFGEGTKILAHKKKGETINILGPLGHGFNLEDDYDTAIIAAGGLGAAPFPYLTKLLPKGINVFSFIGGRTHKDIVTYGMNNISTATDDGSLGYKGNVVELLKSNLGKFKNSKLKIFGCGPNAMLRSLKKLAEEQKINCEVSTECAMACGFGICQGCPIESVKRPDKYFLVCKDGPVFNAKDVTI